MVLTANRSVSALDMFSLVSIICCGTFLLNALINSISAVVRSSKLDEGHSYQHFTSVLVRELQASASRVLRLCNVAGLLARQPSVSNDRKHLGNLPARPSGLSHPLDSDRTQSRARQDTEIRAFERSLREMIMKSANSFPHQVYLGRSTFEAGDVVLCSKRETFGKTIYCGEIVRLSSENGSLTVAMNHVDVGNLVNMGWIDGLRGTAALNSARTAGPPVIRLPAPRCETDLCVMEDVVRAAIARALTCDGRMDEESSVSSST